MLVRFAAAVTMALAAVAIMPCQVEAQGKQARIQASVTVVSSPLPPATADSLVASADQATLDRNLPSGVRIVVIQPPAQGAGGDRPVSRTRRVSIEYVGT